MYLTNKLLEEKSKKKKEQERFVINQNGDINNIDKIPGQLKRLVKRYNRK